MEILVQHPQPISPHPAGDDDVERLRRLARQLWNSEPRCAAEVRTSLLIRLARLESDLEGLHYGGLSGQPLDSGRLAEFDLEISSLCELWTSDVQPISSLRAAAA
jgi:hypothetical protein